MEVIFEAIFELLAELVLQIIFEGLFELGLHGVAEPFRRSKSANPLISTLGCIILGAAAGGISLLVLPRHFIAVKWLQVLNLVFTPIIAGCVMSSVGQWRGKKSQELILLDRFVYGAIFAFALALVRFFWGQ